MPGGSHHHYPFRPYLLTALRTTAPCKLIPLGREHLVPAIIGTEKLCQLARLAFRHPLADPGFHGLSRRPGERQRRQVKVMVPRLCTKSVPWRCFLWPNWSFLVSNDNQNETRKSLLP